MCLTELSLQFSHVVNGVYIVSVNRVGVLTTALCLSYVFLCESPVFQLVDILKSTSEAKHSYLWS